MSGSRNPGRSFLASLAGFAAIFALSMGTDGILHATGVFPPFGQAMSDGLFVLALSYRLVYDTFGCWLAARLAPDKPMQHAMGLGILGLMLSAGAAAATWSKGPEFGPHWYTVLLAASSLPCAWLGGKLYRPAVPASEAHSGKINVPSSKE